jgi:carboxylesterase type B
MHQITAYGGLKGKVPFQQAISQSPGFLPMNSNAMIESIYQQTLQVASLVTSRSIKTTQDLRAMSDMELYYTNVILVGTSPYGSFTFGPVVDGKFVPKLPGELLLHGQFDSSVKVMVGHNLNEGLTFASPFISNESSFATYVRQTIPAASSAVINTITQTLYPPVFDGTYGYKNQLERTSLLISEFSFTCNTRYLDLAYMNQTYSYYFTVPPGFHGEDIAYTFFNGDLTTLDNGFPVNTTVAGALQSYITSFAESGTPNLMGGMGGVPYFPIYGMNSSTQLLSNGSDFGTQVKDTSANARCDYLQKALYI